LLSTFRSMKIGILRRIHLTKASGPTRSLIVIGHGEIL
jgi:hypothetical protein